MHFVTTEKEDISGMGHNYKRSVTQREPELLQDEKTEECDNFSSKAAALKC